MKVYRISRGTIKEGAFCDIREMELFPSPGGFIAYGGRRIKALDVPDVKITITLYSERRDTRRLDRLCAKIRRAVAEYKAGGKR